MSVVIPTYNYGHVVAEAVDSALAQTYPAVEVIVVDDGSTDDTRERLARYDGRIRYIQQENRGLSAARNTGIRAARGKYISLLDSDDAFHPRKLELQVSHLLTHPAVGLVGTESFSDPSMMWPAVPDPVPARPVRLVDLVVKTRFCPSSAVFRRECFEAAGEFDRALRSVEDRDYWIRVACRHPVAVLAADLTYYRITPGSMSTNVDRMEHFERIVLDKAFDLPELRGRRLLRRKALGLASASAAFEHLSVGRLGPAWRRILRSFAWWPVPLRVPDVRMPFARVRLLGAILRRSAWGRAADAAPVPK
ncbi:MAG: glycosyltransferase family 2 protein [Zavarzinella sp.]|nr:glycosyltransferase family 2 protein [Zavarzinella sp.]